MGTITSAVCSRLTRTISMGPTHILVCNYFLLCFLVKYEIIEVIRIDLKLH